MEEIRYGLGRPSKYTPETLEKTAWYIENYRTLEPPQLVPTIAALAIHLGVRRKTIEMWRDDPEKEEFGNLCDMLMANQEVIALNGGLGNVFNSQMSKLLLSKHGYSDKIDATSSDGSFAFPSVVQLVGPDE
jgi:hypothetical protein